MISNRRILILGNGFDLSHGLKTKFRDFVDWVKVQRDANPAEFKELISQIERISVTHPHRDGNMNNGIFDLMNTQREQENWCDAEQIFYDELNRLIRDDGDAYFDDIHELNKSMTVVRGFIERWISKKGLTEKKNPIWQKIFDQLYAPGHVVLNFNYTDTYRRYIKYKPDTCIDIHGQFNSNDNPILFGYSPRLREFRKLLELDESYRIHIKHSSYLQSDQHTKLLKVLDEQEELFKQSKNPNLRLYFIGHSISRSDWRLLGDLVNHPAIDKIAIIYYDTNGHGNQTSLLQALANDSSLMDRQVFNRLQTIRMPQIEETDVEAYLEEFGESLLRIYGG